MQYQRDRLRGLHEGEISISIEYPKNDKGEIFALVIKVEPAMLSVVDSNRSILANPCSGEEDDLKVSLRFRMSDKGKTLNHVIDNLSQPSDYDRRLDADINLRNPEVLKEHMRIQVSNLNQFENIPATKGGIGPHIAGPKNKRVWKEKVYGAQLNKPIVIPSTHINSRPILPSVFGCPTEDPLRFYKKIIDEDFENAWPEKKSACKMASVHEKVSSSSIQSACFATRSNDVLKPQSPLRNLI